MTPLPRGLAKGLLLALGHVLLVAGLGGTLLVDRMTRPRVWARTLPVDPDAPIRGRYVQLRVVVEGDAAAGPATLVVADGALRAAAAAGGTGVGLVRGRDGAQVVAEPLAFFVPEHVRDPSVRAPGEELWAEVTVPRRGPPRPIRLGVRAAGALAPLALD